MTRSPLTAAVDAATKTVWPEVQRAVEQTFRSMAELAGVEEAALVHVESFVAKNGNGSRRRRTIVGETVWAIARLGLLRTPQDAATASPGTAKPHGTSRAVPPPPVGVLSPSAAGAVVS